MNNNFLKISYLNIDEISIQECLKLLHLCSKEKKSQTKQLIYDLNYKQTICANSLIYYLLYCKTGLLHYKPILQYNKFGKPYLNPIVEFNFNISHSENWVVLARSDSDVGIDIEKIQPDIYNIAKNYFSTTERHYINSSFSKTEKNNRFIKIWTLKESFVKFLGTGLNTHLNTFSICDIEEPIHTVRFHKEPIKNNIYLKSFNFDNNFYIATCSRATYIEMEKININDLLEFSKKSRILSFT